MGKTMTVQGNACLLCDLPFFEGSAIESVALVAGQPKMECQNICDPLASGVSADAFMHQLGVVPPHKKPHLHQQRWAMDGYLACSYKAGNMEEAPLAFDSGEGVAAGENLDDLYFYKLKNVPLYHNRPMSLPFIRECPKQAYKDVYFFDLNDKGKYSGGHSGAGNGVAVQATHAITFKNSSGQPFTTGPVSVLMETNNETAKQGDVMETDVGRAGRKDNNFMIQGLMKFTGSEKTATVELTKALDVDGKFVVESAKETKIEAKRTVREEEYMLEGTKMMGKLTINNMRNEDVKCKIDHLLYGHLEKSEPEHIEVTETNHAILKQDYSSIHDHSMRPNPTTKYVWEMAVPAMRKGELVFSYWIKEWKLVENVVMKP